MCAKISIAASANRLGADDPWTLDKIHALFPRLAERSNNMGNQLSGGEQQMLAIGRALMTNPRLLILDEATEGLAPLIREEIWNCLSMLKARGQSVLVIDKNVENLARIADRHYIIERGRAVWSGTSDAIDRGARSATPLSRHLSLRTLIAAAASRFFHEKRLLPRAADKAFRCRLIADLNWL